ncbi:hypothetical protein NSA50_18540 [Clostridium sp. DSM 100503]|uniref:hypothetical protein n=1 Tax=Clostridium sp. DSM 100503 TaxID=2963282 RepID=UPI00214A834A|nr:hypothetical protein [Clostridium sp. DSM 100503]MCR1953002.1 hypothetical protein [Clostridium sp. DSM 100503]
MSKTIELRKDIKKILSEAHDRVFYRKANDKVAYPYCTYLIKDIYGAKALEINIWNIDDKDSTATIEELADNIQKILDDTISINEHHSIILYYNEDRKWIDDEDKRIQRINFSYEIRYYGKE